MKLITPKSFALVISCLMVAAGAEANMSEEEFAKLLQAGASEEKETGGQTVEDTNSQRFEVVGLDSSELFLELDRDVLEAERIARRIQIAEGKKKLRELGVEVNEGNSMSYQKEILSLRQEVRFLRESMQQLLNKKGVQAVDPPQDEAASPSPAIAKEWIIESITIAGGNKKAVIKTFDGNVFRVEEGDVVKNARVKAISQETVVVVEQGKEYRLPRQSLDFTNTSRATAMAGNAGSAKSPAASQVRSVLDREPAIAAGDEPVKPEIKDSTSTRMGSGQ